MKTIWLILLAAPLMAAEPTVCFPPRDQDCAMRLATFIGTAQVSLDVAVYDLNESTITAAIIKASKRIPVRVVMDARQAHEMHSSLGQLLDAKIPVRYGHQRGIMHDKYTLVDKLWIETGSFNYTKHASTANHENSIYMSGPIVGNYVDDFEKLWADASPVVEELE